MIVRNKIWEEIKQAYANVLCLRWYTDKQRKYERWYQMFVAIVASGGTFGKIDNKNKPPRASHPGGFLVLQLNGPQTVTGYWTR